MRDRLVRHRRQVGDAERLLMRRHGTVLLPDDDAGREYLEIVLDLYSYYDDYIERAKGYIAAAAPWLSDDEAEGYIRRAGKRYLSDYRLGLKLGLRERERIKYKITTIDTVTKETRRLHYKRKRARDARKARASARLKNERRAQVYSAAIEARPLAVLKFLVRHRKWANVATIAQAVATAPEFEAGPRGPLCRDSLKRVVRNALTEIQKRSRHLLESRPKDGVQPWQVRATQAARHALDPDRPRTSDHPDDQSPLPLQDQRSDDPLGNPDQTRDAPLEVADLHTAKASPAPRDVPTYSMGRHAECDWLRAATKGVTAGGAALQAPRPTTTNVPPLPVTPTEPSRETGPARFSTRRR